MNASYSERTVVIAGREVNVWRGAFCVLMGVYGLVVLLTFRDYGITSDEPTHEGFGKVALSWYLGELEERPYTKAHGTGFNLFAHALGRISPLAVYDTRHLLIVFVGMLGVVAAYRLGALLGGSFGGFLAALFLVITPRFYGNAFNNPTDIPFAAGYLWSVFFLVRGLGRLPDLSWRDLVLTGIVIGWTLGVRIGALLLLAYMGLFWGGWYVWYWWRERDVRQLLAFAIQGVTVFVIAWIVMLICWPWAQGDPIGRPIETMRLAARFPQVHYSFFEGDYVSSLNLPRYYALKWVLLTLPEFVFWGLLLTLLGWRFFGGVKQWQVVLVAFAGVFPLVYVTITKAPLYDSFRHVLFTVPPLVVLAAVGVAGCLVLFQRWRVHIGVVTGALAALVFWDMVCLHPNAYVYFNRIFAGGVAQAAEQYETDYWEHSYRQGIEWVSSQFPPGTRISSGFVHAHLMVDQTQLIYVEDPDSANVYLGATRFDRHKRVPGEVLHVIRTAGVPLLYVVRPDSSFRSDSFFTDSPFRFIHEGEVHEKAGELNAAIAAYEQAIALDPEHMRTLVRLGDLNAKLKHFEQAIVWFNRAVAVKPDNSGVYNNLASAYHRWGKYSDAEGYYRQAIALMPDYVLALFNLGNLLVEQERFEDAIVFYKKVVAIEPDHALAYRSMGFAYFRTGREDEALKAYEHAGKLAPDDLFVHYNLGVIAHTQGRLEESVVAFERAVQIHSAYGDAWIGLGEAYLALGRKAEAIAAFQKAVALNQVGAQEWLDRVLSRQSPM